MWFSLFFSRQWNKKKRVPHPKLFNSILIYFLIRRSFIHSFVQMNIEWWDTWWMRKKNRKKKSESFFFNLKSKTNTHWLYGSNDVTQIDKSCLGVFCKPENFFSWNNFQPFDDDTNQFHIFFFWFLTFFSLIDLSIIHQRIWFETVFFFCLNIFFRFLLLLLFL